MATHGVNTVARVMPCPPSNSYAHMTVNATVNSDRVDLRSNPALHRSSKLWTTAYFDCPSSDPTARTSTRGALEAPWKACAVLGAARPKRAVEYEQLSSIDSPVCRLRAHEKTL